MFKNILKIIVLFCISVSICIGLPSTTFAGKMSNSGSSNGAGKSESCLNPAVKTHELGEYGIGRIDNVNIPLPNKRTWDGGGADNNWMTSANWSSDIAPIPGDTLVFAGSIRTTTNNDFVAGTAFAAIIFASGASSFALNGNDLTITGDLKSLSASTINNNINISSITTVTGGTLTLNGNVSSNFTNISINRVGTININGSISGTASITLAGTGTLKLAGANTFSGGVNLNSGTLTLANAVCLGSSAGILTINGGVISSASTLTLTQNNPIIINSSFNFSGSNSLNLGAGNVTLNTNCTINCSSSIATLSFYGVVSGIYNIVLTGMGSLSFNGTSNNFTGSITNSGTGNLILQNLVDENGGVSSGGNPSVGNGTITLGNGASTSGLVFSGAGPSFSTNRTIDMVGTTGGATISSNKTTGYSVTLTSDIKVSGLGNKNFTLSGTNSSDNTLAGLITDPISSTTSFYKTGTGLWTLTGLNTYSGTTNIQNGILKINTLSNVGIPCALGKNGTINLGNTFTTGTLIYTGGAQTTDRVISLTGTTGGAVIENAGTGLLKFIAPISATGNGVKTLQFQGNLPSIGEFAGAIVNSTSPTAVTKSGTGTWILSASNTYTGTTTISDGILQLGIQNAIPNTSINMNGGTLSLNGFSNTTSGTLLITANSTIDLGAGGVTLAFAASNATTWTAGQLTIKGWVGGYNKTAATVGNPKIIIGTSAELSTFKLFQIQFYNALDDKYYKAIQLSNGEIVPTDIVIGGSKKVGWDGGGGTNYSWSTGLNWEGNFAPNLGDSLEFNGTVGQLPYNDFAKGTTFASIKTNDLNSSFLITGNDIKLSGSDSVINIKNGSITLNLPITFTGSPIIYCDNSSSLAFQGVINNGGNLITINNNSNVAFEAVISGTGGLLVKGKKKVKLNATPTFSGPITIEKDTLDVGGTVTQTPNISNEGTLIVNSSSLISLGTVSGTGQLIKNNVNILNLTKSNPYTGTSQLNEGTIQFGIADAITNSTIILNGGTLKTGATIGYSNSTSGMLSLLNSATITLGTGNHTLTFAASNTATWVAGKMLSITGWKGFYNGTIAGSSDPKIFIGTSQDLSAAKLAQIQFFNPTDNLYYPAKQLSTGEIVPTYMASPSPKKVVWDGGSAINSNWKTKENWVGDIVPNPEDTLVFDGNVRLTPNNDFTAGTSFAAISFPASAGKFILSGNGFNLSGGATISINYTIDTLVIDNAISFTHVTPEILVTAGAKIKLNGAIVNSGLLSIKSDGYTDINGIISGAGALTKTGSGALTLSGNNTFTGGVNLNQGTINLGNTNCLGTVAGTLTIAAETTLRNTLGTFLTLANYPMKWLGDFSFDAGKNTSIGSGNIQLMGDVTISITNGLYLYNIISGNFSLTKAGSGDMQFMNSSNTYTGKSACIEGTTYVRILPNLGGISNFGQPTTIANGTIALGAGSNSVSMNFISTNMVTDRVIDMAGTTGSIYLISNGPTSSINFLSNFTATGNGNKTIEFIAESKNNTVSGSIPNPVSGIISLNKSGVGKWTLSGNNTYTGATIIFQGVLQIGNGGTSGALASTAIWNYDTLIIDRTNTMTYGGIISGTGKLIKKSAGILTLSSVNTYTGGTTITEGTIELGITNALSVTSIVLNGGILSTGSSVGFSNTTSGKLTLLDNSKIALGTGNHILTFAASNGTTWTAGKVLKITGWNGNFDGTNTGATAHLITGSSAELTSSKLAQIQFYRASNGQTYSATQLATGEIVPTATLVSVINKTAIWDGGSAANDNWTSKENWVGDIAPIAGDTLVFDGKVRLTPYNDFATGIEFAAITFNNGAGDYTLSGNAIAINNGGTVINCKNNNKTIIINNDLTLGLGVDTAYIFSNVMGHNLNIKGVINATAGISLTINNNGNVALKDINNNWLDLIKKGNGILTFNGNVSTSNRLTLKISQGKVETLISNKFLQTGLILNGGTFSTGSGIGYSNAMDPLTLKANSTIALGTGSHTLTFAASNGVVWTAGNRLIITGWQGGYDGTTALPAGPKIYVGTQNTGLSVTQKAQVFFLNPQNSKYYEGDQLSTGEIVPTATIANINKTATWDGGGGADTKWSTAANWSNDVAPIAGDTLVFDASAGASATNDFTSGTAFSSITFKNSAASFALDGNDIVLIGGANAIAMNSISPSSINMGITFNAPTTISGVDKCMLILTGIINTNNNSLTVNTNNTGTISIQGNIIGTGNLSKIGTGNLLVNANSISGNTIIGVGKLELHAIGALNASSVIFNGGTLSTAGFSNTTSGTLTLTENSTIDLGTGGHTLSFGASNGTTWVAGKKLIIIGWNGGYNSSPASPSDPILFIGNTNDLSTSQLAQIQFYRASNGLRYTATQLANGEIVPTATLVSVINKTAIWDGGSTTDDNWTTAANWVGDIAPIAGDTIVFDGKVRLNPNNDFPTNTAFVSIGFSATADTFKLNGNPIKLTGGLTAITTSSNKTTIFNHDITFTNPSKIATSSSGTFGFNSNIDNGGYDITFDINGGTINFFGIISGNGGIIKNGNNVLLLDGQNNYLGTNTITKGTIKLTSAEVIPNVSKVNFNGGGLLTTAGNTEYLGELILSASSLISLEQGYQSLVFASSNGEIWNAGDTLTIRGWKGGYDGTAASNSDPKLQIGASANLSTAKLDQIQFYRTSDSKLYKATQLANGEIVPTNTLANLSPLIVAVANLSTFTTTIGLASTAQTFKVTGSNLTDKILLSAPTNYELSVDGGLTYTASSSLQPVSGKVDTTIIFVRIRNTAPLGDLSIRNIDLSSTNAPSVTVGIPIGHVLPTNPFITQPKDTAVCSGTLTKFMVKAIASSTFQWQEDKGSGFVDIVNSDTYKGATTDTLTITAVTSGMNAYHYRCVANSVNSTSATLTVNNAPIIDITIVDVNTICKGDSASVKITRNVGTSPWSILYNDGTNTVVVASIIAQSYVFKVGPTTTTTYTLEKMSDNVCKNVSLTSSTTLTVDVPKTANFSYAGNTFCKPSEKQLPLLAPNATKGLFSPAPSNLLMDANTGEVDVQNSSTGTYIISNTVTSQNACITSVFKDTIYIHNAPTASLSLPISALKNVTLCEGEAQYLKLNTVGVKPLKLFFKVNEQANDSTLLNLKTDFLFKVKPTITTKYQLVSISDSVCTTAVVLTDTILVKVKTSGGRTSEPVLTKIGEYNCTANTLKLAVSNNQVGQEYHWYRNGRLIVNATTDTLDVLAYGDYTLNTETCYASNTIPIAVSVFGNPPVITATGIGTSAGSLQTNLATGSTIQWYLNDFKISDATQTSLSIGYNGTYKVSVKEGNCYVFSKEMVIKDSNYPDARVAMVYHNDSTISLEHALKNTYTIVPNPSKDEIHILGPDMTLEYVIIIRDITGKILYQEQNILSKNAEHNISSLPTDLYIVELQIDKQSYFVKLVKN